MVRRLCCRLVILILDTVSRSSPCARSADIVLNAFSKTAIGMPRFQALSGQYRLEFIA